METKRALTIAGWAVLVLGILFSLPWVPTLLVTLAVTEGLQVLLLALVGLGTPLVLGLTLLRWAERWLSERAPFLADVYMVLGGLWALAGPLSVLNFRYAVVGVGEGSSQPVGLALVGVLPLVLGLVYLARARAARPLSRIRLRRMGGWIYVAVAALQVLLGLLALVLGEPLLLVSWLTQGSLATLMVASLFEQRAQAMGAFFVSLGLIVGLLFIPGIEAGQDSTFVLNPASGELPLPVPDASFPTGPMVGILVFVIAGLGAWQAVREVRLLSRGTGAVIGSVTLFVLILLTVYYGLSTGFFLLAVLALTLGMAAWQILRTRETSGVLGAILFLFILAFIIWASRGRNFNFTGLLVGTLEAATPIALGALSGIWCERSAVINIAIEGMMLSAAFTAVVIASATGSQLLGLLVGALTGGLLAALLAVLAIRFKVDQIIAGTAINIFSIGATSFLGARLLAQRQELNMGGHFGPIPVPVLSRIPVVGPVLFQNNIVIYLMLLLVMVTHIILFYTRWGLRSRAVGEHPTAADTLGVNVFATRYINVIIGGLIAGIGGAYFTVGSVGRFDEVMTAGRGFIGLAAMIFGRWNPVGALGSSLIFGFASSLQIKLGFLQVPIPSHFLLMAPYLATIVVLAGIVGRAVPPAADGQVYEKH